MSGLRDLKVWRRAIRLVKTIYQITRAFPREELSGLTSQIRRAAISVPSNIAEGYARSSRREYARFVSTAQGSLAEVMTQMHIAVELEYVDAPSARPVLTELDEVGRISNRLRRSLTTDFVPPNL